MPEPFAARYGAAVANRQLRDNLLAFQRSWRVTRDARMRADADPAIDFVRDRDALAAAKDSVIADQAGWVARFTDAAMANGMQVHLAAGAPGAAEIIAGIIRACGATRVIKTKSMVSEEIELNHWLAEVGILALETDVGEWIMQLRQETPAHMVLPAIHLNRAQVAATIASATGHPVPRDDVGAQVTAVRQALRPSFLGTDVGVTGANALIAENGSVAILTNEGNESLLTAVADVHIVLAGIEKLLPTLDDFARQVRLLARSATGQVITTYTTLVTAPHDGQEVHVVLLDNGRSAMAADAAFADALRCIRCAACASVCPPYQAVGGQVFGHIYSGAIGLVNTPFHHGLDAAAGPQSLCVSCNACADVCPVAIPLPRQILAVRERVVQATGVGRLKGLAFAVWRRPVLFRAAARTTALLSLPLRSGDHLRMPRPRRQRWRTVPAPALRAARNVLPERVPAATRGPLASSDARGLTVAFFLQCITDVVSPSIALAAVRVISACGADVLVPRAQHCCGLPMYDSGERHTARALARQTIETLESTNADWIVSTAGSCVVAIAHEYRELFAGDLGWSARAGAIAARTVDLSTFLTEVARLPDGALSGPATSAARLTYHPFCQSLRILGAAECSRRLLTDVCGLPLLPLEEADVCCGFGGSTSITAPEVGHTIAERKLGNIDTSGASTLVTDNPGCLLHLRSAAQASGRRLRAVHVAEILAECLDAAEAQPAGATT